MSQQSYEVTGMTCQHCVNAVRTEVGALDGVSSVDVDLVPGGTSTLTLTVDTPVDDVAVAAAVDEAGYEVAGTRP